MKISFIGSGNVATALALAFKKAGHAMCSNSRSKAKCS